MFKSETLFILGAGSSYPYGYPLGKELVKHIIDNIEHDQILIPLLQNLVTKYHFNEYDGEHKNGDIIHGYELNDFEESLVKQDSIKFSRTASPSNIILMGQNNFYATKLNQFNEFFRLRETLIKFDPISIDTFLRDHPSHVKAGKIMIVYSLLKCENTKKLSYDKTGNDNWYSFLLNDILSGCEQPADIQHNKLKIITFNYDLSLDYCLMRKLMDTEYLKGNKIAEKYIHKLLSGDIYHVYGKLYKDSPIDIYGHYSDNTKKLNTETFNTKRLIKALQSHESIRSIYQERKKSGHYSELIKSAKEIIIIGFGFDRDNLNLLSFPQSEIEYGDFFNGKTIRYLDYEGKMNGLFSQFDHLQQRFNTKFSVTRSTANKITNAYLHDFKISLY